MGNKLAIRGHSIRGKKVIDLLEMMGGSNIHNLSGNDIYSYYIIKGFKNEIRDELCIFGNENIYYFTLEEFLEKFPFKVGDVIKFPNNMAEEIAEMKWDEELEDVIYTSVSGCTRPSLVPKNTNNKTKIESTGFMQLDKTFAVIFNEANYEDEVELQLGDYEIEVRDGKTYAVKKKPKYPKLTNLSDCKEILGEKDMYQSVSGHKGELLTNFQRLLIFRDAYWKIAGEQMGLGKPWEPDWNKLSTNHEFIVIEKGCFNYSSRVLVFPTTKIRDAFYNNFKDLIEQCKELL